MLLRSEAACPVVLVCRRPERDEQDFQGTEGNRTPATRRARLCRAEQEHSKHVAVADTLHMLRHSYATALVHSGENAKIVQ